MGAQKVIQPKELTALIHYLPVEMEDVKPIASIAKYFMNNTEYNVRIQHSLLNIPRAGVLSGEKQRLERSYDFIDVCGAPLGPTTTLLLC